jgi:hypothetical protein
VTGRLDGLRQFFPTPFVAIVALLLVLIVLTPNLLSTATPAAGSLPTEAELVVDRIATDNVTHFYVRGIGGLRYASIAVSLATNVSWPPKAALANVTFGAPAVWKDVLDSIVTTPANPVVVNVTATYVDAAGTRVDFVGVFAFDLSGGVLYESDYIPSGTTITSTPIDALPLTLLLETVGPGGTP